MITSSYQQINEILDRSYRIDRQQSEEIIIMKRLIKEDREKLSILSQNKKERKGNTRRTERTEYFIYRKL